MLLCACTVAQLYLNEHVEAVVAKIINTLATSVRIEESCCVRAYNLSINVFQRPARISYD